jgi:protein-tyrosine phosphatase
MPVRANLFTIPTTRQGTLSTMARPRGGGWLVDEVAALRAAGADVVVSLLTEGEARELELAAEAEAARMGGLRFISFPIQDFGVPPVAEYRELLDHLGQELQAGSHVVVHCRGGIGRSSLVAIGVLVREGQSVPDACRLVSTARGMEVPETAEQRGWLERVLGDR